MHTPQAATQILPFDSGKLQNQLQELGLPYRVIFAPRIDSTMNCADYLENCGQPIQPGIVVVAGEQTGGIGMRGRWFANQRDLAFTVVLPDPIDLRSNILTGIAAGLAVRAAAVEIAPLLADSLKLKLLNDVLKLESPTPRKLSGVLEVGRFQNAFRDKYWRENGYRLPLELFLVGVGVNLTRHAEERPNLRRPACSMESLANIVPEREDFLFRFLRHFHEFIGAIQTNPQKLCAEVTSHLYTDELRELRVLTDQQQVEVLTLCGVTPEGFLHRASACGDQTLFPFSRVEEVLWDL